MTDTRPMPGAPRRGGDTAPVHGGGGYWRPGDAVGHRQFRGVGPVTLESGRQLPDVTVAYETWGSFTGDNAVLVEHALTGDSHVTGQPGPGHPTAGWWGDLVGPGSAIDTDRYFVVAANVLGGCQGSTGPSSRAPDGRAWGSRFPAVTVRDQVAVEARLATALGIDSWALVIGGSMGGMRALEWSVSEPERVRRLALVASNAAATAEQIALCSVQLRAIRSDPQWLGGDYYESGRQPEAGLAIARQIAHISYRSESELGDRFGRRSQRSLDPDDATGRFAVQSYLDHQADKLLGRFDAGSYVCLTESMNSHDIGRGRGGLAQALHRVTADTLVMAVDSDRLYLPAQQREMARHVRGARLETITSPYGHDGFLLEYGQVARHLQPLLQ